MKTALKQENRSGGRTSKELCATSRAVAEECLGMNILVLVLSGLREVVSNHNAQLGPRCPVV